MIDATALLEGVAVLAAEDITELLKQVQANAADLGLIWTIRPGLVTGVRTSGDVMVKLDDGNTAAQAIPVTPLQGQPLVGARVYVVQVPPNGNYCLGSTVRRGDIVSRVDTSNTVGPTSADLEALVLPAFPAIPGDAYRIKVKANSNGNTADNACLYSIHDGTTVAGTIYEQARRTHPVINRAETIYFEAVVACVTAAPSKQFVVSISSSTGTVSMVAFANGRCWAEVEHAGDASKYPGITTF